MKCSSIWNHKTSLSTKTSTKHQTVVVKTKLKRSKKEQKVYWDRTTYLESIIIQLEGEIIFYHNNIILFYLKLYFLFLI